MDRCQLQVVGRGVVVSGHHHLHGQAPVHGRWVLLAGASFRLWGLGVVCGRWVLFVGIVRGLGMGSLLGVVSLGSLLGL